MNWEAYSLGPAGVAFASVPASTKTRLMILVLQDSYDVTFTKNRCRSIGFTVCIQEQPGGGAK